MNTVTRSRATYRAAVIFLIFALVVVLAALPIAALAQGSCTYQVKSGDTASAIATSNGLTLGQLRAMNYGDPLNIIFPGQSLNVCVQRGIWSTAPTAQASGRSQPSATPAAATPCRIYYDGAKIRINCS